MSKFSVGDLIDERYEVIKVLGEGGMGVVYKVRDNILAQVVALKTLLPAFVKHKEALVRFINEVKVSLMLNHPNIIRVYDIRRLDDIYYMTMQYIDGFSLYDWLEEDPKRDIGETLEILGKVSEGLDYAHRKGTFHRDIKPANIMMTLQKDVYLVDFGLAKLADGMGNITRLGGAGTPNYMAPEQKRGGEIDQRADIYAVGVMSFEMLTGELPKLTMASKLNPKLNTQVDGILSKAMASDPNQRYGSILSFFEDLREALLTRKVSPKAASRTALEAGPMPEGATRLDGATVAGFPTQGPEAEPRPKPTPESVVDMIMVPAGHFWMGSRVEESRNESEKPRHRVLLNTYYIDKFPVTNQSYRRFVKETGCPEPPHWADPQFNHPLQPVVGVSWQEAEAYAQWANKRLPTEAEWEKAARGPEGFIYPWGNQFAAGKANVDYTMNQTSQVGRFPGGASAYGCQDLIGNVWEWCADWFEEKYYGSSPSQNPQGPKKGQKRVIRGGAWDTISFNCRNAFRFFAGPASKARNIGFRCAVDG
ncbi:MAG: SUMF1/EgtB/PvdO family nonheme iron enzyme [Deltaproteobacteria bacterium]|nr:SUMF1/EgtB/PvdO family nonheme iron enzyme [Deltaproteobacteria bacterium]